MLCFAHLEIMSAISLKDLKQIEEFENFNYSYKNFYEKDHGCVT
jgi:hypothetical protein